VKFSNFEASVVDAFFIGTNSALPKNENLAIAEVSLQETEGKYMTMNGLLRMAVATLFVFFAYGAVSAQEKETANDTTDKPSKIKVVVTDGLQTAADKTKDAASAVADTTKKTAKTFGNRTVEVTEGVVGEGIKQGRYYTVKTWDGTKWVSKQVFYETKKVVN
jgi:uncharacterized protein YktB (UPF0637 family)